jgi:nitroreductase
MDVFVAVKSRHSVRSYLPDPVPKVKLDSILESAPLSPSAMNRQPWHFVAVTDSAKRKVLSSGHFAHLLEEAPVVIVGCGGKDASPKWYAVDTAIAMQTTVLVATGEGLGTCWIGSFNEGDVKAALGIPPSYAVVALLAIGYPHDKPSLTGTVRSMLIRRRGMESIASYEIFGNGYNVEAPHIGEA